MPHKHSVYDTDLHFKINPITGAITDESTIKKVLKQNDHNSERRTFEIPRYIDGHDTNLCNKVYIHYLNIDTSTHEENPGLYPVEDMQLSPEDEDVVIFSWLLSRNVTKYAGSLSFLITFLCVEEDGEIVYQWSTDINSDRGISKGMNNSEAIVEKYADVIEAWRQQVIKDVASTVQEAVKDVANNISYNDLKDKPYGEDESVAKTYIADTYSPKYYFYFNSVCGMELATTDVPALSDFLKFYTFDACIRAYPSGSLEETRYLNETFEGAGYYLTSWGYVVNKTLPNYCSVYVALVYNCEAFNAEAGTSLPSNGIYLCESMTDNSGPDGSMYTAYQYSTALHRLPIKNIESKYISMPTAGKGTFGAVATTSNIKDPSGYTPCPIIGGHVYYKDTNTIYSNLSLGQGYLNCKKFESIINKEVYDSNYQLSLGGIVAILFDYAVPANSTLNINGKGAKPMYYRGAKITDGLIKANDIATFIYNGSQYVLLAVDRWGVDIASLTARIAALEAKA